MAIQRTAALLLAIATIAQSYDRAEAITPVNLGTLGANSLGQEYSRGNKVNRFGEVTGETTRPGTFNQPFGYASPFMFSILGSGQNGIGYDLNDVGQIVGQLAVAPGQSSAFRRDNSGVTLLPPLNPPFNLSSYALGTNNLDDVVGVSGSLPASPSSAGTIWVGNSTTPVQLPMNIATDINDSQLVVGDRFNGPAMAVAYDFANQTPPVPMGTLGGSLSRATAVNNAGEAVGYSADTNNQWHAFVWDAGSGMTNLGAASLGAIESRAFDINNTGTVVGHLNFNGSLRAFCWIDGVLTDLNSLLSPNSGWVLQTANGVNDDGWITGTGTFNGEERAFLIRHVPEPTAATLVVVACLAGAARRPRA